MPNAIKKDQDIEINGVLFKRTSKVLLERLSKKSQAHDFKLAEIQEMLAVSMGFANYHEVVASSKRNAYEVYSDSQGLSNDLFSRALETKRSWYQRICPKPLFEKKSLSWINQAVFTFTDLLHSQYSRPSHIYGPVVTVLVGGYSNLVLQAIINAHEKSKLFDVSNPEALRVAYDDLRALHPSRAINHTGKIAVSIIDRQYGFAGLTGAEFGRSDVAYLAELTQIAPQFDFFTSISRADLDKFTSPDFSQNHFHVVKLVDLDEIDKHSPFSARIIFTNERYGLDRSTHIGV